MKESHNKGRWNGAENKWRSRAKGGDRGEPSPPDRVTSHPCVKGRQVSRKRKTALDDTLTRSV